MSIIFILGGARSGKSNLAKQYALKSNKMVHYIATATANDKEMSKRIKKHKQDRPEQWLTTEEPIHLSKVINALDNKKNCILIDCLTLWLNNLLSLNDLTYQKNEITLFLDALKNSQAELILVSNEVGHGIVPLGALSREFVDKSGFLHQQVAAIADSVDFIMAGYSIKLKGKNR